MTAIKFDVSGSDPEKATRVFEDPKPGAYKAKILECKSTKPRGKDRRLEVVYEIVDKKYKGARLYEYINLELESVQWKMDQFLQAVGVATTTKRKGSFVPGKMKNKVVTLRVRAGMRNNDPEQYRAEVGGVFKVKEADEEEDEELDEDEDEEFSDEDEDEEEDEEEEDEEEEDEDEEEEDEDEEEDEEEEDEEENGDEPPYDEWSLPELRTEAKARSLPVKGTKKDLVERLEEDDEDPFA